MQAHMQTHVLHLHYTYVSYVSHVYSYVPTCVRTCACLRALSVQVNVDMCQHMCIRPYFSKIRSYTHT